jgi:hypothetical protein
MFASLHFLITARLSPDPVALLILKNDFGSTRPATSTRAALVFGHGSGFGVSIQTRYIAILTKDMIEKYSKD